MKIPTSIEQLDPISAPSDLKIGTIQGKLTERKKLQALSNPKAYFLILKVNIAIKTNIFTITRALKKPRQRLKKFIIPLPHEYWPFSIRLRQSQLQDFFTSPLLISSHQNI